MKRTFLFRTGLAWVLTLAALTGIQAQRTLPGQKAVRVSAGLVNDFNLNPKSSNFAFYAGAGWSAYGKNSNFWKFEAGYLQKGCPYKDISLPLSQFTAEAGYFLNFLSDRSGTLYFWFGISALAGYETINWGKKLLPDGATLQNRDSFVYGGALTLEAQVFFCDSFSLLLTAKERMLQNSSAKFLPQVGLGFSYIIN